ncbi:hypothetical protein [Thalassococcus profundi]|uniref:hypothetical protein n=1 Tax=Thalassococcus profundi TaxID=2282382 RepID=UPI004057EF9F
MEEKSRGRSLAAEPRCAAAEASHTPVSQGTIEIVLANRRRLVVPVDVAPETLARLLPVVDGP